MPRDKITMQPMNVIKGQKEFTVKFTPKRFTNLIKPNGFLDDHPACHALYFYAQLAHENWIKEKNYPVLEGETDPVYNYHQLFKSIAKMYGVEPEEMVNYWDNIDYQMIVDNEPTLPNEEKYRWDRKPMIRSN